MPVLLVLLCAGCGDRQRSETVSIVPAEVVYLRQARDELPDERTTFVITYPRVEAATPELSRAIEEALSYSQHLGISVEDEVFESSYLEEVGYEVAFNERGLLVVELWASGTGAYSHTSRRTVVVDAERGIVLGADSVFVNRDDLADKLNAQREVEVKETLETYRKQGEIDSATMEWCEDLLKREITADDLPEYAVDEGGVSFLYDYGFPHAIQGLQPDGDFRFTWSEIRPFVRPGTALDRLMSR